MSSRKPLRNSIVTDAVTWPSWRLTVGAMRKPAFSNVFRSGAPERKTLEKAGFRIAPTVNRHEGQVTASVTIEFLNGFLELIYPDSTVPVSPALQAGPAAIRSSSARREPGHS